MDKNKRNLSQIIIWTMVAIFLIAGFAAKTAAAGSYSLYSMDGISVKYPEKWSQMKKEGALFYAADLFSSAQLPTGVSIKRIPLKNVGENITAPNDIALAWAMSEQRDLMLYSPLKNEDMKISGKDVAVMDYAFIPEDEKNTAFGSVPCVARARDVLINQGDNLVVITFIVKNEDFEDNKELFKDMTNSIQIR